MATSDRSQWARSLLPTNACRGISNSGCCALRAGPPAAAERNMSDASFQIPPTNEYVATFTWAASGALVGIRKHFVVIGVFVIALVSSLGGGLVRDAAFLQRTPVLLTDPVYLPLIGLTVALVSLFTGFDSRILKVDTVQKLIDLIRL